ncbi:hypothetical protein CAPTEDRAFT_169992 [Capitella teleta]|uniref:DNA polymerase n=1 Tax=Capitella teleta TaxID=283909 RepID=R7VD68_CAPTE|nr:hypothetical protein CAPTEDRAFT_169992 [Capitella teleta]|eukprot:ELU14231.1 hypothetical protein CAPTEDRAFT_169992 [Capitella teleta]
MSAPRKRHISSDSSQKEPCKRSNKLTTTDTKISECGSPSIDIQINTNASTTEKSDFRDNFLCLIKALIVPTGIGKARISIFKKQLEKYGGSFLSDLNDAELTHVIVDDKVEFARLLNILKVQNISEDIEIVTTQWLSSSLKDHTCKDTASYCISRPSTKSDSKKSEVEPCSSKSFNTIEKPAAQIICNDSSDYDSGSDRETGVAEERQGVTKNVPCGSWVCAHSSGNPRPNFNKHITDKLEALAKTYENTNDRWRALGYAKAIMTLKKHPKAIATWEEAKSLPGVGEKLADKIWEIVESGQLRKLDELTSQEEIQAINLFSDIWGAGATTARAWVAQGFRTLDDIRTKAHLNRHQKIGLQYYEELLDRMPRSEAAEIEAVVVKAAKDIDENMIAMACGSFRRGKATCGDVDVLITHPDGKSHKGVFTKILTSLHQTGFLTDDLVRQEDNGHQKKYLGVCLLPGEGRKHRRLDIIVVPYSEFACSKLYFTGSAHFNRSMRHLAGKMGMSLSEHSLNTGVTRKNGQKLNEGVPLQTPTEDSVFQHLGLKYRPPEERDH